ncbi:MAG: MmgE/PrpD [Alphaproteobacteria bacterium]|nr:MAG: MmgE/PrpD [Alphaproteobacteria bacterium]
MTRTATEAVLSFLESVDYGDIPASARESSKTFLLDTIAVGLSGATEPASRNVWRAVSRWGAGNEAIPIGLATAFPVPSAAAVSAFHIHCQEWDCVHEPAVVHAMSVLTGALSAFVQANSAITGRDLVMALCIGVDLAARLGMATTAPLRFFRPATAGLLGTTAALARLSGFKGEQFADAMGLAYSQVAGTMQAHVEGSIALPLQVALSARAALTAVDLAREGLNGPHDSLEGPFGYFRLIEDGGDVESLVKDLGERWCIGELSHKPYPSGRASHAALDAVNRFVVARQRDLSAISSIRLCAPPLIKRLIGRPYKPGMSVNYARLCLPYLICRLILDGRLDGGSFCDAKINDPRIADAAGMVQVELDDNRDLNALGPQRLEITYTDGMREVIDIPTTKGAPGNPLSPEEQREKVIACLRYFENIDQVAEADRLISRVNELEDMKSAASLFNSLPRHNASVRQAPG